MRTRLIAEVASNHGGELELAKEFVRVAASCGADYVKFQSWQASHARRDDPQYDWLAQSELSDQGHHELIEECRRHSIEFLTTCFEVARVEFLANLGLRVIKVGSADTASYRMLRELRTRFEHVLLSTGMAEEDEVRQAVEILSGKPFTLMHTVSLYPTPPEQAHLRRLDWLRRLAPSVGYSDHTVGTDAARVAIARGADFVEKHFCLGPNGPGRVMAWDATPEQLAELVDFARRVEVLKGKEQLELTPELKGARERFIGRFGDNQ